MGNSGMQLNPDVQIEDRPVQANCGAKSKSPEQLSILDWYRILRTHYHWPLFEAIRYALWLSR